MTIEPQRFHRPSNAHQVRTCRELLGDLSLAILCQHLYIEARYGIVLPPVGDEVGGYNADGLTLPRVTCARCGDVGHTMRRCPERDY